MCNRVCRDRRDLPELRQGPWDMEAAGVLGLAHRQDEGNGGHGLGVLGGVALQQSKLACLRARVTQGAARCGMLSSGC